MRRLLTLVTAAGCLGLVAVPDPARAHSALLSGSPRPGDKVQPGTPVIALTFTELRRDADATIGVAGPGNAAVPTGRTVKVDLPAKRETAVCAAVEALAVPGVYSIAYRATSADGDAVSGKYYFEVTSNGRAATVPADPCGRTTLPPPDTAETSGNGDPPADERAAGGRDQRIAGNAVVIIGLSALTLVGAVIFLIVRRRRGTRSPYARPWET